MHIHSYPNQTTTTEHLTILRQPVTHPLTHSLTPSRLPTSINLTSTPLPNQTPLTHSPPPHLNILPRRRAPPVLRIDRRHGIEPQAIRHAPPGHVPILHPPRRSRREHHPRRRPRRGVGAREEAVAVEGEGAEGAGRRVRGGVVGEGGEGAVVRVGGVGLGVGELARREDEDLLAAGDFDVLGWFVRLGFEYWGF